MQIAAGRSRTAQERKHPSFQLCGALLSKEMPSDRRPPGGAAHLRRANPRRLSFTVQPAEINAADWKCLQVQGYSLTKYRRIVMFSLGLRLAEFNRKKKYQWLDKRGFLCFRVKKQSRAGIESPGRCWKCRLFSLHHSRPGFGSWLPSPKWLLELQPSHLTTRL